MFWFLTKKKKFPIPIITLTIQSQNRKQEKTTDVDLFQMWKTKFVQWKNKKKWYHEMRKSEIFLDEPNAFNDLCMCLFFLSISLYLADWLVGWLIFLNFFRRNSSGSRSIKICDEKHLRYHYYHQHYKWFA